jgi:hypothetical protein
MIHRPSFRQLQQRTGLCRADIKQVEKQMEQPVCFHRRENFENLQSIPGNGQKVAVHVFVAGKK